MIRRLLFLGLLSGVLAAIVSLIYQKVYTASLGADFSGIVKTANIFITSVGGTLLAAAGYWLFTKWMKRAGEVVFNFVFVILTFATILGPFAIKLPLEVEAPELFPGLTVPMHFFPALAWFTISPLFLGSRPVAEKP